MIGSETGAVFQLNGLGVYKGSGLPEEGEAVALKLALPVFCKFADEVLFASLEGFGVYPGGRDLEAKGIAGLGEMQDFGGVEEGLGWHTAVEDAEASQFGGGINNGDALAGFAGGAGGGVATAPAADNEVIEVLGLGGGHGLDFFFVLFSGKEGDAALACGANQLRGLDIHLVDLFVFDVGVPQSA